MPFILPSIRIDRDSVLSRIFTPYQLSWIHAEDALHAQKQRAFILAEKSVRIGWTYADSFKNVRKRLRYKNRDYLFATKDWASALEFMSLCRKHLEVFNVASAIISHGEEFHKVPASTKTANPLPSPTKSKWASSNSTTARASSPSPPTHSLPIQPHEQRHRQRMRGVIHLTVGRVFPRLRALL